MLRYTVNTNSSTSIGCLCASCMGGRTVPFVVQPEPDADEDNLNGILEDDSVTEMPIN